MFYKKYYICIYILCCPAQLIPNNQSWSIANTLLLIEKKEIGPTYRYRAVLESN